MASDDASTIEDLLDAISASADEVVSLARAPPSGSPAQAFLFPLASPVERVPPILRQLLLHGDDGVALTRSAAESLHASLRRLRTLVEEAAASGRKPLSVEGAARELGRHLGLVLLAAGDAPADVRESAALLQRELMAVRFHRQNDFPQEGPRRWGSPSTGEGVAPALEDVLVRVKGAGEEEELAAALEDLDYLVGGGVVWEGGVGIVAVLLNKLRHAGKENRLRIILLLRSLASQSEGHKENMADAGSLSAIVRSLTRDSEESREAVRLLLDLSVAPRARQRMGRIQGCIVMLVTFLNGEDQGVSSDARKLLDALSSNTQNVLLMAEAGYFNPLVQYLKQGSDMNKIIMATALSRIELSEQMKALLGDEGSIEPLVKMFTSGKLEAKLSSLAAIQKLSTLRENVERLITSGIISHLLRLLFSVTSVLMTLREPAAAILACLAQSELILVKKNIVEQILSLLNISSPVIQCHLLRTLSSISNHPGAFNMRVKMRQNGAVQLILPFLSEDNAEIRCVALKLLFNLSKDLCGESTERLADNLLDIIANIITTSKSCHERAAACGILANIPVGDKKATEVLKKANILPTLLSTLEESVAPSSTSTSPLLVESISGVLVRFTVHSDKRLQRTSVELGLIPLLVKVMQNASSPIAKARAATCLYQLSQSSLALCKAKTSRWTCVPPSEAFCEVHSCRCSTRSTFCLIKSGCVAPLIQTLEGKEREADEAVLVALSTLMQDEIWENGSRIIEQNSGVQAIIRVLGVGNLQAQEQAVWMLERIFRIEDHRGKYGAAAQVLLIDLAQRCDPTLKRMIAKVLAHLQLLPVQSSYF